MANLDRQGLRNFIGDGDKHSPPVFVGRQNVLADITYASNRAWHNRAVGHPGETRVVQGAPGAGKTSILKRLEKNLNGLKRSTGAPTVLCLNSSDLGRPGLVIDTLAEMADKDAAAGLLAGSNTTDCVSGTLGGFGFGLAGQTETSRTKSEPPPVMYAFDRWLAKLPSSRGLRGPIIVAVDEIQNVKKPESPAAELLQALHDGAAGRPITLVVAGLSDSENVLNRLGLTRGLHIHRVGRFEGDECQKLMTGFCAHFGIEIGHCRGKLDELTEPTEGWPRHLHWALIALARAALAKGIDGELDRITDWGELERESQLSRSDYYLRQQYGPMVDSAHLVSAVMQQLGNKQTRGSVKNAIEANVGEPITWNLPHGMNVHQFYDHLVHRGALEERADGTVHCPIPSFRKFLIGKGRPRDDP